MICIKSAKTRTLKFPRVPERFLSHFVRGYFDGDGFVKYEKYFVSFVGGSEPFMRALRDEIERVGFETNYTDHGKYFRVYVSGRRTIKIFSEWLYRDKKLYLKRKHEAFQKEKLPLAELKDRGIKMHKNAIEKRRKEKEVKNSENYY